ncbi:MAG: hypothetical protein ACREDQ_03230 [Limisphaerales bacterium]
MNTEIEAKIQMLKSSLECFAFGLLGLLPLIGFPFAVVALVISGKVRVRQKKFWNAAKPYWFWGVVCGSLGIFLWGGALLLIIFNALNPD